MRWNTRKNEVEHKVEHEAVTQQKQGEPTQHTWQSEVDHQENKVEYKVAHKLK